MAKRSKLEQLTKLKVQDLKRTLPNHRQLVQNYLHGAHYDMSDAKAKEHVISYAKKAKLNHKLLNALDAGRVFVLGKYASILDMGGELPEDMEASFARALDRAYEEARNVRAQEKEEQKEEQAKGKAPVLTIQDRMREQAANVAAEFDGFLDDVLTGKAKKTDKFDPAAALNSGGIKAGQARYIRSFYEPELAELQEVLKGKDEQVKEGYSNLSRAAVKRGVEVLESILQAAAVAEQVSKANRKTRKKKAPSTEKLVRKIKFMVKSDELGVASENPATIIGASEAWVYNTKYRKLGRYIAADDAGLSLKGTRITNFSASSTQKTLRKPKEQVKAFMAEGKVGLRKFLEKIKGVSHKTNGKMNANVLILRVFK